jgi:hypothetical protein
MLRSGRGKLAKSFPSLLNWHSRQPTAASLPKGPARAHQHRVPGECVPRRSVLSNGFAQVSPRGSTMVYDDRHIALWERGRGSTNENPADWLSGVKILCRRLYNLQYFNGLDRIGANPGTAEFYLPCSGIAGEMQGIRRALFANAFPLLEEHGDGQ